jgi:hypothetical protein
VYQWQVAVRGNPKYELLTVDLFTGF